MKRFLLGVAAGLLFLCGCSPLGPGSVTRDRFDYNTAIADSWKEQTLLNIVKIRYADMPLFVEVASIVSGYTLEGAVNLGGTLSSTTAVQGDFLSLGTSGKYTDRPTITYAPITGQKFNTSFMTPIPPSAILFLMQSGWPADMILPLTVDSINGLRGQVTGGKNQRTGDPRFYLVVDLFRNIQKSGAVGMRVKMGEDQKETTVMVFHREDISREVEADLGLLTSLLELMPQGREIEVNYGLVQKDDSEIAMLTRSTLQIMIELAAQIDVPAEHVEEGRTVPSLVRDPESAEKRARLIQVNSGPEKPQDVFSAVNYRDHWFWIDDTDFRSKRTFSFLMILFSLTETGGKEGLPLVTIPAG